MKSVIGRWSLIIGHWSLAVLAASCFLLLAAADDTSKPPISDKGPMTNDEQDLVLLTETKPLLVRLHIRVDGQPFRAVYQAAWTEYLKGLFDQADRNGDGVLNSEEAGRLPPPIMTLPGAAEGGPPVNIAFNFKAIDADGDGKVSLAELGDYYRHFSGGTLHLAHARRRIPNAAAVSDALFSKHDKDKNGKLSKEELKEGPAELRKLDQDGDELLTAQEIGLRTTTTTPAPVRPAAANDSSPFIVLQPGDSRALVARRIGAYYAARQPGKEDPEMAKLDLDRAPDLELMIRLGQRKPNEAALEVLTPAPQLAPLKAQLRKTKDGSLTLILGKSHVEFRVGEARPGQPANARKTLLQQFKDADMNSDGAVERKEAQQRSFLPRAFDLLDHNGDGKLTEQEFTGYLDKVQEPQARALTGSTSLLYSDDGLGLFELLDRDRDGRLSLLELRALPGLLESLEADGELSRDDIPHTAHLALGLYRATFHPTGGESDSFTPPGMPLLTFDWSGDGLGWFRKMDRNGDGIISPREFLGPRDEFQKLDLDGDGLVSVEEARRTAGRKDAK